MDQESSEAQSVTSRPQGDSDTVISLTMAALTIKDEAEINCKEVTDILHTTVNHLSRSVPSSSTSMLIRKSRDEEIHKKLEELITEHFHPLELTSLPSIVIFLLLHYFLLKRENKETESAKKLYEDHIALLKEKNSDLEERVRESTCSGNCTTAESCTLCKELRQNHDSLSVQYAKLKQSYDELCHINQQWAMDYETLTKSISNATGFHSVANSASPNSTSSRTSTSTPSQRHLPDPSCVRCSIYESQLEDKQQEVEDLRAIIVGLREDVKDCKERLSLKQKELTSLENEYHIIRLQMQEIGDLQQTLNMKQDYRKMQRSLQQKTKQYQDAMCEKLELQKQVEKLRQTFLQFFPHPNPGSAHQPHPSSFSSSSGSLAATSGPRPLSGGFYSFPMHSCRHNIQSHTVDPNPPTPPGLLARGDLRGGHVEKDDHPMPGPGPVGTAIRLSSGDHMTTQHQHTITTNHHHKNPMDASSFIVTGQPLPQYHMTSSNGHLTQQQPHQRASSADSSPTNNTKLRSINESELVLTNQNGSVSRNGSGVAIMPRSHSSDHVAAHFHSRIPMSTTSLSPRMTTASYSNGNGAGNPQYNSSSLSSLGYVSDDLGSLEAPPLMQLAPNATHFYPSRSKSSLATYNGYSSGSSSSGSGNDVSNYADTINGGRVFLQNLSTRNAATQGSSQLRPTSLGLVGTTTTTTTSAGGPGGSRVGVVAPPSSRSALQQQAWFLCPNCKKTFTYSNQDSFDPWFEHIKFCNA